MSTMVERFYSKYVQGSPDECWLWKGSVTLAPDLQPKYGKLTETIGGKTKHLLAHRVAYEQGVGPIPEGLTIDHLCREKLCVNPGHPGGGHASRERHQGCRRQVPGSQSSGRSIDRTYPLQERPRADRGQHPLAFPA